MQCLILAGGVATRMRPLTANLPKSLIPVEGVPFVDFQLRWLAKQGVDHIVLSIGFLGHMIRQYVGDGRRWGLRVTYVDEGEAKLGTGGAVALCLSKAQLDKNFFLLYGDSFLPISFGDVWNAAALMPPANCMMTVYFNRGHFDRSNVCFRDGQILLYDKFGESTFSTPFEYIDYGLSVLDRDTLAEKLAARRGQEPKFDIAEIMTQLSREGSLSGYEVTERFYEVGSPSGLQDFSRWLKQNKGQFQ